MIFIGLMWVKNESRWIEKSLCSQQFCDRIIVLDDHSSDNTKELCLQFSNVEVISSPFLEYNEGASRAFLANFAKRYRPDWIVSLDGDEVLEPDAQEKILAGIAQSNCIEAHMMNFWNSESSIRTDGNFGKWVKIPVWKMPTAIENFTYPKMHGSLPNEFIQQEPAKVGLKILHYGNVDPEHRRRKYELYKKVDPDSHFQEYEDLLKDDVNLEPYRI